MPVHCTLSIEFHTRVLAERVGRPSFVRPRFEASLGFLPHKLGCSANPRRALRCSLPARMRMRSLGNALRRTATVAALRVRPCCPPCSGVAYPYPRSPAGGSGATSSACIYRHNLHTRLPVPRAQAPLSTHVPGADTAMSACMEVASAAAATATAAGAGAAISAAVNKVRVAAEL